MATLYPLMAGVGAAPRVDTSAMATYLSSAMPSVLGLTRDSSSVLALRNGTTAQRFQVSGTYTDASNYERGAIYFSSGKLTIGYEAAGTGTAARNIEFVTNGQTYKFASTGALESPWSLACLSTGVCLYLGGYTSSFPAIKRSGAAMIARLADDSADAAFTSSILTVTGAAVPADGISKPATGEVSIWSRSLRALQLFGAASAVNWVSVANSATGGLLGIAAQGSDTDVGFYFSSKGAGDILFETGGSSFLQQFRVLHTASAVNRLQATGGATGGPVVLSAAGTDTDIDLRFTPKGAGVMRFGTHSALGAETVTGYITIKDAGGTTRKVAVVS